MQRITTITYRGVNYFLDWFLLTLAFSAGVVSWWLAYTRTFDFGFIFLLDYQKLAVPYLVYYGTAFIYLAASSKYRESRLRSLEKVLIVYIQAMALSVVALAMLSFFLPYIYISRTLLVSSFIFGVAFLTGKELLLRHVVGALRKRGLHVRTAFIIGDDERLTRKLLYETERDFFLGVDITGLIDPKLSREGTTFGQDSLLPVVGTIRELVSIINEHNPDVLIVYARDLDTELLKEVIAVCEERGLDAWVKLDMLERVIYQATMHSVRGMPFISFHGTSQNTVALFVKYTVDRIVAAILLILLSPVFALAALLVKYTSEGPVFFSQPRAGLNGRPFQMHKFRSMVANAEELKSELQEENEMQGPHFKMKNDPRITSVGRILRKTSIDELPQLWNVFLGQMSLVGPRPMDAKEVVHIRGWHRRRLSMKPGITCIWQVSGRNEIREFDDWARLDLEYIDNWSLMLDVVLLIKTIPVVLFGRGAS